VPPDAKLLRAWGEGDTRAGRALFERHYPALFRFFRNKVARGIEDLVQDTFAACLAGLDRLRDDARFRAFLFGTARNVLRSHYERKRRRDDPVDFGTHSIVDLGAGPSTLIARRAEHRLLLEALRQLPTDDQIVLELYMWESLTGPELAGVLDITEPAVRSRIRRSRDRLAQLLRKLAASSGPLESTETDLDRWADGIRELLHGSSEPDPD
jgi:RNA polymerase sigma-70 factor (ECF subfamily)